MAEEKKKKISLSSLVATEEEERKYVEPDEWYSAIFEKAEGDEGKYGPYIKFFFKLRDGQFENSEESAKGFEVNALIDARLSPGRKLWEWAKVMLGEEPKVGKTFDLTAFYGERFRVLVCDRKKKKGDDTGPRYQHVDSIKRPKEKNAEPPAKKD